MQRDFLREGLRSMAPALETIAREGEAWGLDGELLTHLRPGLLARARELAALA